MIAARSDGLEETRAQIARYAREPRYAAENLLVVKDEPTRSMIPLRYNEAQVMLQDKIDNFRRRGRPVRLWILKARRAGMSTGCEANIFTDTLFHPGTNSLILANEKKPARNILEMCHAFWKHLPAAMKPALPPEFRNRPPKDELAFPDLASRICIATALSLDQYLGFGFSNVHATEVARWRDGEELMTSIYPTLDKGPKSAFYGESTARGQGNFFHEQCMIANESGGRHGGTYGGFELLFVPWHALKKSYSTEFMDQHGHYDAKARKMFVLTLDDSEKALQRQYPDISLEQLHWRRGMLAGPPFNSNEDLFDQEFPSDIETAFLATGAAVFTRTAIKRLAANKRQPIWTGDIYWGADQYQNKHESDHDLVRRPEFCTEGAARRPTGRGPRFDCTNIDDNYKALRVYRWPEKGERLAVCADVAGGIPNPKGTGGFGDYSVIAVVSKNEYGPNDVCMTWRGHIRPVQFGVLCSALCWALRARTGDDSPPLLAPEWNGVGAPMNAYIDDRKLYSPHFLYIMPGVKNSPNSHHYGFESNGKTIPIAMGYLQDMVEKGDLDVPDQDAIIELSSYKKFPGATGEEFGGEGAHDDYVCALRIAAYLIRGGHMGSSPQPVRLMESQTNSSQANGDEPFDRFEQSTRGVYASDEDDDLGMSDMDWG